MIFLNGCYCASEEALVSVDDRGFLFGDGVYDVVRCFNGKLFKLQEHLARLLHNAERIMLDLPYTASSLTAICRELQVESGISDGIIYLQVTRGAAPRTHRFPPRDVPPTMLAKIMEFDEESLRENRRGIKAVFVPDERWGHCDIKSINLLPNVLAREAACRQGAYEAIFVHPRVGVTECGSSNIFAVLGDKLVTAPLGRHILPGIMRETVLQLAEAAGIPVELRYPRKEELLAATEVFATNSVDEIAPVLAIDEQPVGEGRPGRVTLQLQGRLETLKQSL